MTTDSIRISNEDPGVAWVNIINALEAGDYALAKRLGSVFFRNQEEQTEPAYYGSSEDQLFGLDDGVAQFSHRAMVGAVAAGFKQLITGDTEVDAGAESHTITADTFVVRDSNGDEMMRVTTDTITLSADNFIVQETDGTDMFRIIEFGGSKLYYFDQHSRTTAGDKTMRIVTSSGEIKRVV